MARISGVVLVDGQPRANATVKLWSSGAAFLTNPPQQGTALPLTGSPVASTTSGPSHGGPGAYRFSGVTAGDYFVSIEWNSLILYDTFTVGAASVPDGIASVQDYGAVGDGVANDTVAIQAALDDTAVNQLYFPPGTYLSGNLNITSRTGLTLEGNGATLDWTGTGTTTAPIGIRVTGTCREITIKNLHFTGDGTASNYHGGVWCTTAAVIENLRIDGCHFVNPAVGVWLNRIGSGAWQGIWIEDCYFVSPVGTGTTQGMGVFLHHETTTPLGVTIARNNFFGSTLHAIRVDRGTGIRVLDNQIRSHRTAPTGAVVAAIHVGRCTDVIVRGNHIHEHSDGGISIEPSGNTPTLRVQIRENILTNAGNAIQDINAGTADPAADGGLDQIQIEGNIIRKTGRDIAGISFRSGLRSRICNNQLTLLALSGATTGMVLSGAGDSGGTRTYTDDVQVEGNLIYSDVSANLVGIELGSAFCTSTARAVFRGNRLRGVTMFLSGASIQNDSLQVIDQEEDGLSFDATSVLAFTETGPVRYEGARQLQMRGITANRTLNDTDEVILVDASGGAVTVTLPTATGRSGQSFTIIKTDASANTVAVTAQGGETIQTLSSWPLIFKGQSVTPIAEGTNAWYFRDAVAAPWTGWIRSIAIDSTLLLSDSFLMVDTSGGNITITLPTLATTHGKAYAFFKASSSNDLIIDGAGAETVDGGATDTVPNGTARLFGVLVNNKTTWDWAFKNFA